MDKLPKRKYPKLVSELPPESIAAVMQDDVVKLQSFREAGAHLNAIEYSGNSLLNQAIRHKKAAVFDYLLTLEDVPLDEFFDSLNPVEATFKYATEDFALKLIERGCDIEIGGSHDESLLHRAMSNKWIEVAEKLIEKGDDIDYGDETNETPLLVACREHLVDEVFMLLFYGADPSIRNYWGFSSLDMLVKHKDKKMQDFFLNVLYPHYNVLNLKTLVDVMQNDLVTFPKLLENTTEIVMVDHYECLESLAHGIADFHPGHFKLFIDKFCDIFEQVWDLPAAVFFFDIPECKLHRYVENLYIILDHHILCPQFVEKVQQEKYLVVDGLVETFKVHNGQMEILTKLVCCFLSHGIYFYHEDLYAVFKTYGYCELFKIMLHMDVNAEILFFKAIMPAIIYDVNISVEGFVKYYTAGRIWEYIDDDDCDPFLILLDYFALPELKAFFMKFHVERLIERVQQLPTVSSLVELARNSARSYIISKYKTKNSSQFYTVLKCMPIAKVLKQIIAFERKLYLPTNK